MGPRRRVGRGASYVCRAEGVAYLSRQGRLHGKAGNVNHALRYASGRFVAVFDADHVPHPNFLVRTLGHFADPRVAFVQTPQSYVVRRGLIARGARHAQSVFYREMTRVPIALFNVQDVLPALLACLDVAGRAPRPNVRPGQPAAGSTPCPVSASTWGGTPPATTP